MPDITFADYASPALPMGDYTITVTQTTPLGSTPFAATRRFTVSGERFTLPPARITAAFLPDGSLGDHHNVLPHAVLDRPTLPWERQAGVPGPWLVLLVFAGAERPQPALVRLGDLSGGGAYFPPPVLESHQSPDDQVTVIDVPRATLAAALPSAADLPYLAHVRRTEGAPDVAVVIGNRLPPAGNQAVAHLVSVEGRYGLSGFDLGPGGLDSLVRLVSLASWRFACLDVSQNFASLVRDLAQDGSPYRLPDTGAAAADAFLRQGFVAVRHQLRNGGATVSWYRGPFATGQVTGPPPPPALTADQLVRFLPGAGMFDVSFAAAWTLGRLLALQSTDYATALYDWKRRRSQKLLRAKLEPDRGYPLAVPEIDDDLPDTVRSFLAGLAGLDGVPASYLIPDERLLPPRKHPLPHRGHALGSPSARRRVQRWAADRRRRGAGRRLPP